MEAFGAKNQTTANNVSQALLQEILRVSRIVADREKFLSGRHLPSGGVVYPSGQEICSKSHLGGRCGSAILGGHGERPCEDTGFAVTLRGKVFLGVFDGMGGCDNGAVASNICAAAVLRALLNRRSLSESFSEAQKAFMDSPEWTNAQIKPGTTACVARIQKNGQGELANLGDSRAYIVLGDLSISQISKDNGKSSAYPDDLKNLYQSGLGDYLSDRNYVPFYLGKAGCLPEINSFFLHPGDRLVLMSDGVSDVLTKKDISLYCNSAWDPQTSALELVRLAHSRRENKFYGNDFHEAVYGKQDDRIAIVFEQK